MAVTGCTQGSCLFYVPGLTQLCVTYAAEALLVGGVRYIVTLSSVLPGTP